MFCSDGSIKMVFAVHKSSWHFKEYFFCVIFITSTSLIYHWLSLYHQQFAFHLLPPPPRTQNSSSKLFWLFPDRKAKEYWFFQSLLFFSTLGFWTFGMRSDLKPNDFYMYFYGLSRKKKKKSGKWKKMENF